MGPRTRRGLLQGLAGLSAGLSGCSAFASGSDGTPTLTPVAVPGSTPSGEPAVEPVPRDAGVAVGNAVQRYAFFYTVSHGATGVVGDSDRQYVFVDLERDGDRPHPSELRLVTGAGTFRGTVTPGGILEAYAPRLVVDRWGPAEPHGPGSADWVAFDLPAPLATGRAFVEWAAADRVLFELRGDLVQALGFDPPDLRVRALDLPESVSPADQVPFAVRVHNRGGPGMFRGVLSWRDAPATAPMQVRLAGAAPTGTTTLDGTFESALRFDRPELRFRLESNAGPASDSVGLEGSGK